VSKHYYITKSRFCFLLNLDVTKNLKSNGIKLVLGKKLGKKQSKIWSNTLKLEVVCYFENWLMWCVGQIKE